MKLQHSNIKELLKASLNKIENDMAITNCQLVNVITGTIHNAIVYVHGGYISHVEYDNLDEQINAKIIIDANGKYLIPGFIDSHVHIESSMMTPRNFAKAVINCGTTTVVTDPHEIGNVHGKAGVKYMHDVANGLPMRQLIDIPSCVPSVPNLEFSGADFVADDIIELAQLERVIGLAEVMSYLDVINGEDRMHAILDAAKKRNLYLQGHAPFLTGRNLSAYLAAGPNTCHETRDSFEAKDKFKRGMFIDMRDSSMCKNVPAILEGIKEFRYLDHLCICTDDRESDDILNDGHINDVVRIAIRNGMHPIDAIRSATYNSAREIKIENLGAIAPGFVADMVIIDNLKDINVEKVIFEGNLVSENGKLINKIEDIDHEIENINSVNIKELSIEDLKIKAPIENGIIDVNCMIFKDLQNSLTDLIKLPINVVDGYLDISNDKSLSFVAVVNRFDNDNIALAIVKNFGINKGCVSSTVSHDSHNLTMVYHNVDDAIICANEIKSIGGGMVSSVDGEILHTLKLKVAGLMSTLCAEELKDDVIAMKQANRELGLIEIANPLLRIVTLALPVIPNVKMSDLGMVEVNSKTIINLFD